MESLSFGRSNRQEWTSGVTRVYFDKSRRYRISQNVEFGGPWLACRRFNDCGLVYMLLSRHRTKGGAIKACEKDARKQTRLARGKLCKAN